MDEASRSCQGRVRRGDTAQAESVCRCCPWLDLHRPGLYRTLAGLPLLLAIEQLVRYEGTSQQEHKNKGRTMSMARPLRFDCGC
jgi:hypothetical protein